ncbi:MAG: ABC transporter ATP-binding protein [Candidatus Hodarchaeota archaeon]
MANAVKIKIGGLTKYYGSTRGIENLNLEIQSGEIFGFLGENGAGKTTTIRCMMNILLPNKGEIRINGDMVSRKNPKFRENIGYMPGEMLLPENYTVKEFLKYIASMRRKPSTRRKELCKRFGLPVKKRISDLSKGNKQKVGIIIAFMHDPDVYILDEPTGGLDPLLQQEFYDLLLEEKKRGKTIFFSSHNLAEVQKICDRVGIVRDGFLVNIEDIRSLSKSVPRILEARLRKLDKRQLEPFGERVLESNDERIRILVRQDESIKDLLEILILMDPEELSYPPASLEEYFLQFYQGKEGAKTA